MGIEASRTLKRKLLIQRYSWDIVRKKQNRSNENICADIKNYFKKLESHVVPYIDEEFHFSKKVIKNN